MTPDAAETRRALERDRADLVSPFDEALPGARAAVLHRLWTAVRREPLPGIAAVQRVGGDTVVHLADGRMAVGPDLPPFQQASADLRVRVQQSDGGSTGFADPAELLAALRLPTDTTTLETELANSVANLALARAAQPAEAGGTHGLGALQGAPGALALVEQAVVDGHPLHPCCRTRTGMSTLDVLRFAPEHGPVVELEVWEVPRGCWLTTGSGLPPRLPVHPWQAERFGDRLRSLGARPTGDRIAARPLMSLRTLASVRDPSRHYKVALGVQMTSAVRQVSPDAVHNGPRVTELLARLAAGLPLRILPEPAAGAVLGDDAAMLAVALRRAPLPGPGDVWAPVAALTAGRLDGSLLLDHVLAAGYGGHPVAFWRDLVDVLVPPVLTLLSRGAGLEAHGQNLLVRLNYGRPAEAGYRDVGGVRLHPGRLRAIGVDLPPVRGSLVTDDVAQLRAKPFATLLATVLADLAATLAHRHGADPAALWRMVAEHAEHAPDAGDRAALAAATLPVKATTAMRLAGNADDIWTPIHNPLGV